MAILGVILILVGLSMAQSGFTAKWRMSHYQELTARGENVVEYNYHIAFRGAWWIPTGIGILLIAFS